jgi:GTPase
MPQFIDTAKIWIQSGKGGDGKVSFHREKYVASGGPDGGDGGRGGSVVFQVDDNLSTLMDFRYKRKYKAEPGEQGGSKRCTGKDGKNLVIRVPRGTILRDAKSGQVIKDLSDSEPFIAAKGGRGGWGNVHFATPTRQTPRFAKPGMPGQELEIRLELKLLADVGLVGFPNVGKSTLLSMASAARPKIANYHFTTLVPNLGVVRIGDGESFVMADIPGIIEGASEGAGLGHDFLRHIDRCRLLLHVVDAAGSEGRDPIDDLNKINDELAQYSMDLENRPQIVVANKIDLFYDDDHSKLDEIRQWAGDHGFAYAEMSAATNQGVRELMNMTWHALEELPPVLVYEPEFVPEPVDKPVTEESITYRRMNEYYIVEGEWIDRLFASINFDDYESRQYLDRRLRSAGVFDKLEEMGIKDGDPVVIGEMEFEYER